MGMVGGLFKQSMHYFIYANTGKFLIICLESFSVVPLDYNCV